VKLVNATGESLMGIITSVSEISTIMGDIASAGREQATGLEEVNGAVSQMDSMTQKNAAMVEENTAAARSLLDETNRLVELMSFFHIGGSSSTPAITDRSAAPSAAAQPSVARLVASSSTAAETEASQQWDEF
jgi:methyl-accepting chemotaxis protein